jgi:probable HAF family extracellular repeat protein
MSTHPDRRAFLTQTAGAALAMSGLPAVAAAARGPAIGVPPRLRITDLGDLGGSSITVRALNDRGVATGMATRHDGDRHGVSFKSREGRMVGLPWEGISTVGAGINNSGAVAGYDAWPWRVPTRAWVWSQHRLRYIGNGQVTGAMAMAINDAGMVAGMTTTSDAFLESDGEIVVVEKAPNCILAMGSAVNSMGDMVGYHAGENVDIGDKAFVRFDGRVEQLEIAGAYSHEAFGVNDSRQVCGWLRKNASASVIAFVWQDGQVTRIPPLIGGLQASSQALAINNAGVVVGVCGRPQGGTYAFMWQEGVAYELNKLIDESSAGWRLFSAAAINNQGQIVGKGAFNGVRRAFLATPV